MLGPPLSLDHARKLDVKPSRVAGTAEAMDLEPAGVDEIAGEVLENEEVEMEEQLLQAGSRPHRVLVFSRISITVAYVCTLQRTQVN